MREIEIKVQVKSSRELLAFLNTKAKLVKEDQQKDEYFSPSEKSFINETPVKEWLRLRSESGQSSLNYKFWHYQEDGTSNHCDEYETIVGDPKETRSILLALGFEPLVVVDKKRRSYRYQDYEISVDEVRDLGSFIEIEWKGDPTALSQKITDQMVVFLEQFHPGEITRNYSGYPKLLLEKREVAT